MFAGLNIPAIYKDVIFETVMKDRSKYIIYFKIVEKYIADKPIILGDISAYKTMIKEELNPNEFQYNLYSKDIFNHAKELAKEFYRETNNIYIYIKTKIVNHDVAIFVDERELVTITSIEDYKGASIGAIIGPVRRPALYTSENIALMSPEILLISIYRALHSPAFAKKWEEYLGIEAQLFEIFLKAVNRGKFTGSRDAHLPLGSRSSADKKIHDKLMAANERYYEVRSDAQMKEKRSPASKTTYVYHLYDNRYVSSLPQHELSKLLGINEVREETTGIPFDFRLRRISFYENERAAVFIFNSAQYDLMNDSPLTKLRFMFIDLWILQLKRETKKLTPEIANKLIEELIDQIVEVRGELPDPPRLTSHLFPLDYFGVFYDEMIAKKQQMLIMRGDNKFGPPNWYPAAMVVDLRKP
jgi:hypothetical protein